MRKDKMYRERRRRIFEHAFIEALNIAGALLSSIPKPQIIEDIEHEVVETELKNQSFDSNARFAQDNAVEFDRRYRNQTR